MGLFLMEWAEGAHRQPARVEILVVGLSVRLHADERLCAASPKQVLAIAHGFELPALFEEAPIALEGGSKVTALLTTGMHDGVAEVIRIKQHHHRGAYGGAELPD